MEEHIATTCPQSQSTQQALTPSSTHDVIQSVVIVLAMIAGWYQFSKTQRITRQASRDSRKHNASMDATRYIADNATQIIHLMDQISENYLQLVNNVSNSNGSGSPNDDAFDQDRDSIYKMINSANAKNTSIGFYTQTPYQDTMIHLTSRWLNSHITHLVAPQLIAYFLSVHQDLSDLRIQITMLMPDIFKHPDLSYHTKDDQLKQFRELQEISDRLSKIPYPETYEQTPVASESQEPCDSVNSDTDK